MRLKERCLLKIVYNNVLHFSLFASSDMSILARTFPPSWIFANMQKRHATFYYKQMSLKVKNSQLLDQKLLRPTMAPQMIFLYNCVM